MPAIQVLAHLHQQQCVLHDLSGQRLTLFLRPGVQTPLQHAAAVPVPGDDEALRLDGVDDEGAVADGQVLQTPLDDVVAVGVGGQVDDPGRQGGDKQLHLLRVPAHVHELLHAPGACRRHNATASQSPTTAAHPTLQATTVHWQATKSKQE